MLNLMVTKGIDTDADTNASEIVEGFQLKWYISTIIMSCLRYTIMVRSPRNAFTLMGTHAQMQTHIYMCAYTHTHTHTHLHTHTHTHTHTHAYTHIHTHL